MLILGCFQSITEQSRNTWAKPRQHTMRLPYWAILPCGSLMSWHMFSELCCSLRGILPSPPFCLLSFQGSQVCTRVWGSQPPLVPSHVYPSWSFSNKSFALLFILWHLLPRGPVMTYNAIESTLPQNVYNWDTIKAVRWTISLQKIQEV